MAKNNMKLNYKKQKRVRKNNITVEENNPLKQLLFTTLGVLVFIGIVYLGVLGLEKLGTFEKGYTKKTEGVATIDYEFIPIGTVFNRKESVYYVLFDNYKTNKEDPYVNTIISKLEDPVYKVDMSLNENAKYASDKSNAKATKVKDLKINGVTLIKINKGHIAKYITGSDKIEEYINK